MEQKFCTGCDRHCPADALHCGKGRKLFGVETKADRVMESGTPELLSRCARMLRRVAEQTENPMAVLTAEEQQQLTDLLTKLAREWKAQMPDKGHHHHGKHH